MLVQLIDLFSLPNHVSYSSPQPRRILDPQLSILEILASRFSILDRLYSPEMRLIGPGTLRLKPSFGRFSIVSSLPN